MAGWRWTNPSPAICVIVPTCLSGKQSIISDYRHHWTHRCMMGSKLPEACWHIYASVNLVIIGSDNGSSPNMATNHYLNQWWLFVKWTLRNKLQWNLNQNKHKFFQENARLNVICRCQPFCSSFNVLPYNFRQSSESKQGLISGTTFIPVMKDVNTFPTSLYRVTTLASGGNGWYFASNIFKCILLNENFKILIKILLK